MNKITVHLKKSGIGANPTQRKNLIGLGLIKTGKYKVLNDTSSVRGMIRKVIHLVEVSKGENIPAPKTNKKAFEVIAVETTVKKNKVTQGAESKKTKKTPATKKVAKAK